MLTPSLRKRFTALRSPRAAALRTESSFFGVLLPRAFCSTIPPLAFFHASDLERPAAASAFRDFVPFCARASQISSQ
jgi:hypothetical protein